MIIWRPLEFEGVELKWNRTAPKSIESFITDLTMGITPSNNKRLMESHHRHQLLQRHGNRVGRDIFSQLSGDHYFRRPYKYSISANFEHKKRFAKKYKWTQCNHCDTIYQLHTKFGIFHEQRLQLSDYQLIEHHDFTRSSKHLLHEKFVIQIVPQRSRRMGWNQKAKTGSTGGYTSIVISCTFTKDQMH